MYLLKFIRKDNLPEEDYYYQELLKAMEHINLFIDDDSNLYRNISVLNTDTNYVEAYLGFDEIGVSYGLIKDGDIVKLRRKWCSTGEEKYIFVVTSINEESERCLIKCINSSLSIGSSETVDINMIERV